MKIVVHSLMLVCACSLAATISAQTTTVSLPTLPAFPRESDKPPIAISRESFAGKPVSVIGPSSALLGDQSGEYEAWIFPWKIFSGMRVTARMENYPVPIDVTEHAAWIDVTPASTTITYSHANFTVRQIMVAPKHAPEGAGPLVFYQIEAVRPMTLTFSFDPVMQRMWPAQSDDRPSPEWVDTAGGSGFYILHENFPDNAAALAMPRAEHGILPPYQERAKAWPLQFVLHFDPQKDRHTIFPLLMTFGNTRENATRDALAKSITALDASAERLYQTNDTYYRQLLSEHTSIETPDEELNAAFAWAEVAIDQLRVQTAPGTGSDEQALTAGFVASGDAARPGFGWFFGRDALWSLYAVNSYGDFVTARQEFEFLLRHQRADGKIMHERSQTAGLVDWQSLPYQYASADATPMLQMAADDYLKISGDASFIRANWEHFQRAWSFETSHDSDDGIYNNSVGTGWVESWIPTMPHQEIYLAVLDEMASTAFADLARAAGHSDLAEQATRRAHDIGLKIEQEYFLPAVNFYAFSRNADGTTDDTATIFPSVAWWDGTYKLDHAEEMMRRWGSSEFSTDWGARILSDRVSFYDPISYHQGSVWPLFTGWLSVAEYRAGHPLVGYAQLMQNAELTRSQDLGDVTELLSGEFYQVLGRSTAHQLWSSAMVISPVLRGMFGLMWDSGDRTLTVTPHLPADWDSAKLRRVPLGSNDLDLTFTRHQGELLVEISGDAAKTVHLTSLAPGASTKAGVLHIPLSPVEASVKSGLPEFGAETRQMKVLDEQNLPHELKLTLAAQPSSQHTFLLRENEPGIKIHTGDAEIGPQQNNMSPVSVVFPPANTGDDYVTKTVMFTW
jgi:glycogen debranching enzyme